jgi:hypothetical protein
VYADCAAEEEGHLGTTPRVLRFARARRNPCTSPNVPLKHEILNIKQMQYTSKTIEIFETCTCNIYVKYMQYVDKNICNIYLKHMKHFYTYCNI